MTVDQLKNCWQALYASERGRAVLKGLKSLFVAGILAYLVYRLSRIGWAEVWTSMPEQPLFYVLLLAIYVLLPISEGFIYGRLWHIGTFEAATAAFRKRVLNNDVLSYSGEVHFFAWAKKRLPLPPKQVLSVIKDNLILSSVASTMTAALLLVGLFVAGYDAALRSIGIRGIAFVAIAIALALMVGGLIAFRRAIFGLPARTTGWVFAVHLARFFAGWVLQIWAWHVVVPSASLESWAVLLAVMVVVNRIPLVPSKDLIFASMGIELSYALDIPVAAVAAMLLVRSAFDKVLNLSFFGMATLWERRHARKRHKDASAGTVDVLEGDESSQEVPAGVGP